MSTFLQHVANGVVLGSIYVMVALGVTLVYGLTRLINFAHGEIVTLGAFMTYVLVDRGMNYFVALPIVAVLGAVAGAVLDRGVFRFTRSQPINGFLVSLGLIAFAQAIVLKLSEDEPRAIRAPISGTFEILGVQLTRQRVFTVVVAAAMFALLLLYLRFTRAGRGTRAYAENPDAAAIMGVDDRRVVLNVFVIGSAQAAIAGGLLVGLFAATPALGASMIIKAFAVALIGGLGSVLGAAIGGLGVGLSESLGSAYVSSGWSAGFGYIVMLIVLMIRPTGLGRGGSGAEL